MRSWNASARMEYAAYICAEKEIQRLAPYKICRLGIARTYQIAKPFGDLSVLENAVIGAYSKASNKKEAYKIAGSHDVILVAGKGHEDYQILADETIHFDDREKVREIFGE